MKRSRIGEDVDDSDGQDDVFDDGDDLMARAAEMMDFDDDEEDSGSENDEELEEKEQPAKKKQKSNGRKKSRSPSSDPLQDDVEAVNVLQLQVDALLSSIRSPSAQSSKAAPVRELMGRLKAVILAIPSHPAKPAQSAVAALSQGLPYDEEDVDLSKVQWQLAFSPPTSIQTVGSWPLGASHKWKGSKGLSIDLALKLPSDIFQEKDVKDHRYFFKRAYFLAKVKKALSSSDLPVTAKYSHLHDNRRKPVIELEYNGTPKCTIRLIPTYDATAMPFDATRLHPSKNNIRTPGSGADAIKPTPIYNADIASDGMAEPVDTYLEQVSDRAPAVAQAVLLLKVWSKQRGHAKLAGLSNINFVHTVLLAYIAAGGSKQVRQAPANSSSWQLFRGALTILSTHNFAKIPIVAQTPRRNPKAPSDSDWPGLPMPVLTDPTGTANLLAHAAQSSLETIRYDAKRSLEQSRHGEQEAFRACLLTLPDIPHLRFDHTMRLHLTSTVSARCDGTSDLDSPFAAAVAKIDSVLRQALADRIKVLSILPSNSGNAVHVDIGLIMEASNAARIVEHGPPADNPVAVKAFRAFWGSKAETRRFKDGRILESVVWEADGPAERVKIFEQVIRHVMSHHLGLTSRDVQFFAGAYDRSLVEASQLRKALYTADPALTGFGSVMSAFDGLVKELKGLQGLPLAINSVTPISEGLRYTSTFVPGPYRLSALPTISLAGSYCGVQECLINFEGSGRWPEDLHAIQKVKAAFLTKIAEAFRKAVSGARCEVAFDLDGSSIGTRTFLDILTPEGFAFRLWINHARERNILENTLLDESLTEDVQRPWQQVLVEHHQQYVARPAHHAAIAALQSRHASFSTTVRITKRWLAAHLLLPHIATELVELLCAKVYLDAGQVFEAPNSGMVGFARTLSLLTEWKWREEPLLIPLYGYASRDTSSQGPLRYPEAKQKQAETQFSLHRKADPAINRLAWCICTEQDTGGRAWEPKTPSKMVAARVQELARACLSVLAVQAPVGNSDISSLFTPPLDGYDFLLHLEPSRVSRHRQAIQPDGKALAQRPTTGQTIRIGYDAVQAYVDRATLALGDTALLFHDPNGGLVIAGLFNPSLASKVREFRITLDFSSKPALAPASSDGTSESSSKASVCLDREAVVNKLVEMSEGLVSRVRVK